MSYANSFFRKIRSSPLFDRSELVCRRKVGKRIWLGRIRKRASPAENSEKKLRNSIACENYHLAGPLPLYFTHKNTRRTQKSTFPDLPEWVWTADAGHTTQPPAEKISNLFDTFIRRLWVGGSGRTFSDCLSPTLLPFRIGANLPSFLPCFGQALLTC